MFVDGFMKARLGEIFEIGSGGTPSKKNPEYYNGNIPWIKTGDLKEKYLYKSEDYITELGLNNSSAKMCEPDTVLIAMYGATIGATSILKIPACTNQACATFKKSDKITPEFLYYFFRSQKERFVKDGVGGAQPNISAGYLKKIEIELLPLKKQNEITNTLDKLQSIITHIRTQLEKLDLLVKARFVEMFGDCQEYKKLEEYTELITKGASPKWQGIDYSNEGTLFVTSENVREGYLDLEKRKYLPNNINRILPRSVLKRNDILINIVNASIGRVAIYESDELANINQAVALVRLKPNTMNLLFLLTFLNSDEAINQYNFMKVGGDKANLSLKNIADLKIPVASLETQKQFADFVQQVDKSRTAIQNELKKAQMLFDSLMQEYFA